MKTPAIICVDDEKMVLVSLKTELKKHFGDKFLIETAESGEDALQLYNELSETNHEVVVIISDYVMPGMKGDELLKQIHTLSPATHTILLTGQATIEGVSNAINWANLYRYMSKPWETKDLLMTVQEAIRSFEKNSQIAQKTEELQKMNEFLEYKVIERTTEVVQQKNEIEKQRNQMLASIQYAKRIQQAVLPTNEFVDSVLDNHFILFRPKDIVSGDFYFISKRDQWLLIAVADCTGHGVPGAFLSMLISSFLNQIIIRGEKQTASYVLDELRSYVIKSLQQKGMMGEQHDGMDIAFIVINLTPIALESLDHDKEWEESADTYELQFSGAYNPLYIIKKLKVELKKIDENQLQTLQTFKLFELSGDRMPISMYVRMNSFTNQTIHIQKGDSLYLMSDGFKDQFGGPDTRKYMARNLKQLLFDNCTKPMHEQKEILENSLDHWKNGYETVCEQTDDITVMGIKI